MNAIGYFIVMICHNELPVLNLLILASAGIGVLVLMGVLILKYFNYESAVVMKTNELKHLELSNKLQEAHYKEGLDLRKSETEFNHTKEILKLLVELRKSHSTDNVHPTPEDVKKLKEYLANHKELIQQITEIVKNS
ncbi:MAG: hypothetical protein NTU44_15860 [Bacteroidetes bacterium]|nr:hypothetical protein [Bacteroidota bacterium]